ncbi:protein SCO1/2 [Cupriavidus sp. YR651]|uniref:SCO family protein n=1 Tax=Cupriavidus sp. YR651 TaxID=1855315 RepID=UPI00088D05B7|nr:SCO family protein [Cupriavidus sp. YR651]SDD97862.1 protein SCO1/2 [Cupriavidus sp. YR651]
MWRTAVATLLLALLAYAAGVWLTMDFRVWTSEGARRLAVVRSPIAAPEVTVRSPGIDARTLPTLLGARGGATIVDFIYTRCMTVCSVQSGTFRRLQVALRLDRENGGPDVQLLSISIDPKHDTLDVLHAYGRRLQADPTVWRFAAPVQLAGLQALLDRYGVVVIPDGLGGYEHNAALLILDRAGRLVHIYDYDRAHDALALARYLAAGN